MPERFGVPLAPCPKCQGSGRAMVWHEHDTGLRERLPDGGCVDCGATGLLGGTGIDGQSFTLARRLAMAEGRYTEAVSIGPPLSMPRPDGRAPRVQVRGDGHVELVVPLEDGKEFAIRGTADAAEETAHAMRCAASVARGRFLSEQDKALVASWVLRWSPVASRV